MKMLLVFLCLLVLISKLFTSPFYQILSLIFSSDKKYFMTLIWRFLSCLFFVDWFLRFFCSFLSYHCDVISKKSISGLIIYVWMFGQFIHSLTSICDCRWVWMDVDNFTFGILVFVGSEFLDLIECNFDQISEILWKF
jgi:hypothetical protein